MTKAPPALFLLVRLRFLDAVSKSGGRRRFSIAIDSSRLTQALAHRGILIEVMSPSSKLHLRVRIVCITVDLTGTHADAAFILTVAPSFSVEAKHPKLGLFLQSLPLLLCDELLKRGVEVAPGPDYLDDVSFLGKFVAALAQTSVIATRSTALHESWDQVTKGIA